MNLRTKLDQYVAHNQKNELEWLVLNNIFSYCQNAAMVKSGALPYFYHKYQKIHELLKIHQVQNPGYKLVRVGSEGDGGYVMLSPFSDTKIAYSIGIGTDVSWDKDIASMGYTVFQYDHTILGLPEENENFVWRKFGIGVFDSGDIKSLDTMLRDNGNIDKSGMILKMDVDGWEWPVLSKIEENILDKFDQIVMELHELNDLDRLDEFIHALERLNRKHACIHVHANNIGNVNYCGDYITPNYLEITLVNRNKFDLKPLDNVGFPRELDRPTCTHLPDIYLGRWNP